MHRVAEIDERASGFSPVCFAPSAVAVARLSCRSGRNRQARLRDRCVNGRKRAADQTLAQIYVRIYGYTLQEAGPCFDLLLQSFLHHVRSGCPWHERAAFARFGYLISRGAIRGPSISQAGVLRLHRLSCCLLQPSRRRSRPRSRIGSGDEVGCATPGWIFLDACAQ